MYNKNITIGGQQKANSAAKKFTGKKTSKTDKNSAKKDVKLEETMADKGSMVRGGVFYIRTSNALT